MLLVYSHAILWCIYAINRQIHTKFVWSTNPTLGHISGKPYFKDTCAPIFTAAVFITAKTWKQPKCPSTDRWIKRMWYIYTTKYCCCCHLVSHVQLFQNPMDYSVAGSAIHGMFQARIMQWVAISFSRESFKSKDQTCISHKQTPSLQLSHTGSTMEYYSVIKKRVK